MEDEKKDEHDAPDAPEVLGDDPAGDHLAVVSPSERAIGDAAVVHAAAGIPYRIEERPAGWAILTSSEDASASTRELREYAREERASQQPVEPREMIGGRGGWTTGIVWAVALLAFHVVATSWLPNLPWVAHGASDAAKVLQGEAWRTVTALTLHADFSHILSNAAACVLFIGVVAGWLGPGLASWLVLLSGIGGNALNAWLYSSHHVSLGASTLTFGAIGILCALQFGRLLGRGPTRRSWLAIGASLAFFAMLGTSVKTDVLAHLSGLVTGLALGLGAAGWLRFRPPPGVAVQALLASSSVAVVVLCWLAAFH